MDDLTAFVRARLDEDEAAAQDPARVWPGPWTADRCEVSDSGGVTVVRDEYHWGPMPHIARHDPARVLRDIAAKRAILDRCVRWECDEMTAGMLIEDVLAHLATAWSGHPDYRDEWRPAE